MIVKRMLTRNLPSIRAGKVLVAKPSWQEETYIRSVIMLINHGEDGTTGVMVNKCSNLSVYDALPETDHHAMLYYGGPVNKKTISYLHGHGELPDAYYLGNGVYWGGNYEYMRQWRWKEGCRTKTSISWMAL